MRRSVLEITRAGASDCAALGVRTPHDLMALAGGEVVARSRTRSTVRLATPGGGAYLKRYWVPSFAHFWRALLRGTWLGRSKARREQQNAARLRTLGWDTPDVLALAELRTWGGLRGCALLTRAVPDGERLDACLWRLRDGPAAPRRALARALGQAVAALHRAGYVDRNLHARNVVVRWQGETPRLVKLDSPRGGRWLGGRWRGTPGVDLAALDTVAERACTRTDRLRFLRAYAGVPRCGGRERRLLQAVARWRERSRRREEPRLTEARSHVAV